MTRASRAAALVAGCATAFVVAVDLARAIRLALLLDPESSWAIARLLLGVSVVAASAGAGVLAASAFLALSRMPGVAAPLVPLPFSKNALVVFFALALLAGAFFRFADLVALPLSLWEDDVSLIAPSLALNGNLRDFADSVRPVMYGSPALTGLSACSTWSSTASSCESGERRSSESGSFWRPRACFRS